MPLRKSVAYLFRYRDVAQQSNARYLNALAHVEDPTPGLRGLDTITTRKSPAGGRPVKAFNPVARPDYQLFGSLMVSRRFDGWVSSNVGLAVAAGPLRRWRPHPSNPLMRRRVPLALNERGYKVDRTSPDQSPLPH